MKAKLSVVTTLLTLSVGCSLDDRNVSYTPSDVIETQTFKKTLHKCLPDQDVLLGHDVVKCVMLSYNNSTVNN